MGIVGNNVFQMGRPSVLSIKEGGLRELVRVTGNPIQGPQDGSGIWEIERGIEGTIPQNFTTAATIEQVISVGGIQDNFAYMLSAGLRSQFPDNGRLFLQFDAGWQLAIYASGTWNSFAPIYDVIPTDELDFSWVNQGSATLDTSDGISEITAVGSVGEDVHMRVQDVTDTPPVTPPYDLTWAFVPLLSPVNQSSCGFVFRDSSSGEFIFFRLMYDSASSLPKTDLVVSIDKFDSPTVFNSNYVTKSVNIVRSPFYYFRMRDNSVDLEFLISSDGKNYRKIFEVSRTDFLSSIDQFGYAVNSNSSSGAASVNVLHFWKRATS